MKLLSVFDQRATPLGNIYVGVCLPKSPLIMLLETCVGMFLHSLRVVIVIFVYIF